MILAGWAWDDGVLLEVARSSQADAAILLLALGLIGLLFSALRWLDRRALRREIHRAHQPRPFDPARATASTTPTVEPPARPFAASPGRTDTHGTLGGGSTRQENAWQ